MPGAILPSYEKIRTKLCPEVLGLLTARFCDRPFPVDLSKAGAKASHRGQGATRYASTRVLDVASPEIWKVLKEHQDTNYAHALHARSDLANPAAFVHVDSG